MSASFVTLSWSHKEGAMKETAKSIKPWCGKRNKLHPGASSIAPAKSKFKRSKQTPANSQIRYQRLFETIQDGILILDARTGAITDVNPCMIEIMEYSREEVEGKKLWEIGVFQDIQACKDAFHILQTNNYYRYENLPLKTKHGQMVQVEFVSNSYRIGNKKVIQCTIRDITERKQKEEELRFANIILSTQQEASIDGILVVDENGKMISFNQRFVDMWSIPFEVIESKSDERALESVLGKLRDPEEFLLKVKYLYENKHEASRDEIPLKDGRTFDRYSASMIGTENKYYGRVWYFRDITERKQAEELLSSMSLTDELTGLYNRRGFTILAEQQIKQANRMKRDMLLFFGDMDGLKIINDILGHAQGDQALIEIAAVLKETFRESDIIARLSGDEFAVLAPEASGVNADVLETRLQETLAVHNRQKGRLYKLSLSLGIARYDPKAPSSVNDLLSQADKLMYRQKQARKGKAQYEKHNQEKETIN